MPKAKQDVVRRLDAAAKALGRPKNELVIEALEQYFHANAPAIRLSTYPSRAIGSLSRRDRPPIVSLEVDLGSANLSIGSRSFPPVPCDKL